MAGLNTLSDVYRQKGDSFVKELLDKYVIINEQMPGSFFGVKKKNNKLYFFKKDSEISVIDRILTKYYEKPISYILTKTNGMDINSIPEGYLFGMQYIRTNTSYPKLYLTFIHDEVNDKYICNKAELTKWATILGVNPPLILHEGTLDEIQKRKILDFIYTPYSELLNQYRTQSFTKYILDVLNATSDSEDIDGIIFRFYDDDKQKNSRAFVAKLLDPIFVEMSKQNEPVQTKPNDYIYLVLLDLINYIETYRLGDLQSIIKTDLDHETNYMAFMNKVFKDFVEEYGMKYLDIKFDIPDHLKSEDSDLNLANINDDKVLDYLNLHQNLKEIYKILINFFRKKKKNTNGIVDSNILLQFNKLVEKIHNIIQGTPAYEGVIPTYSVYNTNISEDFNFIMGNTFKDTFQKVNKMIKVNIIIDSFQPLTMDHITAAELLQGKNGRPCVFVVLHENIKNEKTPFKYAAVKRMMDLTRAEYANLIADVVYVTNSNIESVINALYPNYQPYLWGTNKKRISDYMLQFDYAKRKNIKYNLVSDFKLIEVPISKNESNIIKAIADNSFNEFKSLTPRSIHSQFFNLQSELANK